MWITAAIIIHLLRLQTQGPQPAPNLAFEHLNVEHGLSQSNVTCLLQDQTGFLWIGTYIGLNRYDGTNFTNYLHEPENPNGLPCNQITCLLEDRQGRLWIGTEQGLARLDNRDTDHPSFVNFKAERGKPGTLAHNLISALMQDRDGTLWVGTAMGLHRFNPATESFANFGFNPNSTNSLSHPHVSSLLQDRQGRIWAGTIRGLTQFSPDMRQSQTWLHFDDPAGNRFSNQTNGEVHRLLQGPRLIDALADHTGSSITRHFRLNAPARILAVTVAEANWQSWLDRASIYRNGTCRWEPELRFARHAGGGLKNRISLEVLDLEPGKYQAKFEQDFAHDPGGWTDLPPDRPDWWGLQLLILPQDYDLSQLALNRAGTPSILPGNHISDLIEDAKGQIWVTARNHGAAIFPAGDPSRVRQVEALKGLEISAVMADSNRHLWIAGAQGVVVLDPQGNIAKKGWEDPFNPRALRTNETRTLLEDRTGVIWVGTILGGLYKWVPGKPIVERYSRNPYLEQSKHANWIYAFAEGPRGTIWLGSLTGISAFGLSARRYLEIRGDPPLDTKLNGSQISALHVDNQNTLWIGAAQNLWATTLDDGPAIGGNISHGPILAIRPQTPGKRLGRVNSFWEEEDGSLLVGTNGGLFRIPPVEETSAGAAAHPLNLTKLQEYGNLPGLPVRGLIRDRSSILWFGTWNQGLFALDADGNQLHHYQAGHQGHGALSHQSITFLLEQPQGQLWIGTYGGGLNRLDMKTGNIRWLTTSGGLPDNVIYGIVSDPTGALWISTNRGLARVFTQNEPWSVQTFNYADGLQSEEFNQGAVFQGDDGTLFFGGIGGFNLINPLQFSAVRPPPPVILGGMSVQGLPRRFHKPLHQLDEILLGQGENVVAFNFTALDFAQPEEIRFSYRLEGVDREWVTTSQRQGVVYTNLKPGRYLMRLRGLNRTGRHSPQEARLAVILPPPFWQAWWFRLLAVLALMAGLFTIFQLRVLHLRREKERQLAWARGLIEAQERDRARIANELHDSLGQNLLVINNEIQLCAATSQGPTTADHLDHWSDLLKATIEEVRQISYNLRPHQLDRLGLHRALTSMASRAAQVSGLSIHQQVANIDGLLGKDAEIQVFRILQEGLNNIIKHAQARKVELSLSAERQSVRVVLADDGLGFQLKHHPRGLGLRTMFERAQLLGARLQLDSEPQHGTRLCLDIPIHKEDA